MGVLTLKPTHKAVSTYYAALAKFAKLGIKHEGAVRSAFQELLETCARQFDWKLVRECTINCTGQSRRASPAVAKWKKFTYEKTGTAHAGLRLLTDLFTFNPCFLLMP